MTLGLKLALRGDLEKHLEAEERRLGAALYDGVNATTDLGKRRVRLAVRAAGLGDSLGKTWRGNVYPRKGKATLEPAGLLYTKAPHIMEGFSSGGFIRSKRDKGYLAIPTEFTPRTRGRRRGPMYMREFLETYGEKSLRIIPGGAGRAYAVADKGFSKSRGKRGGSRKVKEGGRGKAEPLLMYVLVKQVRLGVRINLAHILGTLERQFPKLVAERVGKALSGAS